jgi:hypothetical protein
MSQEQRGDYVPEPDGSVAAEDDSRLRRPADEVGEDPDVEQVATTRSARPVEPAAGPDDPEYTGEE